MNKEKSYLTGPVSNKVQSIVQGIDKDVEHGEDILMLGLGSVMMSTFFAPIAPPPVLLPLVAITFVISSVAARIHYHNMKHKLQISMELINTHDQTLLKPIAKVFDEHPPEDLSDSFNPIKHLKRTVKSVLGGVLINPFWMPIFYMMGVQIGEEKNLNYLNFAILCVEKKIAPKLTDS